MLTAIESERFVVISDMHLGNPFSTSKRRVAEFIRWAGQEGYDIIINGDGLEIAQVDFKKLAHDVPEVLQALGRAARAGCKTYYVVGNHDIVLEHFLEDFGHIHVSPFLNIKSGGKRVRVEHGHLYDPFFVKHPDLYELLTWIAGFLLKLSPKAYKLWIAFEKWKSHLRARRKKEIPGEPPEFFRAANELANRGFDLVIFGHTHHLGTLDLEMGARYFNPGSWMLSSHYVCVENGQGRMLEFKRHA